MVSKYRDLLDPADTTPSSPSRASIHSTGSAPRQAAVSSSQDSGELLLLPVNL